MSEYVSTAREGYNTPVGTWKIQKSGKSPAKARTALLSGGSSYAEYLTRFKGAKCIHTVPYKKRQKSGHVNKNQFNKLGSVASGGCVRVPYKMAKFIYENCPLGTPVIIYEKANDYPMGKPTKYTAVTNIDPTASNIYHNSKVIVGEAAANEKNTLTAGQAGDQKKEVRTTDWYDGKWEYLFRAKDEQIRNKIAQAMLDTCNNDHIGYDTQKPDRYSAYDAAEVKNWDISKITKNCETTCSQAVSMCMRAAGIPKTYAPRHCDIAVMQKIMPSNPYFTTYTQKDFLQKSNKLLPGDILLSSNHTVIIVKSPNV